MVREQYRNVWNYKGGVSDDKVMRCSVHCSRYNLLRTVLCVSEKKQTVAVKESLLCLSGQLRVARMTMPQALAQIGQKSRYDYLSQFYIFVSENLEQHTYSGFWETWASGIDSYVRDIYLTESDSEILKNIGSIPLHLDIQMQLAFLEENISELENLIEETQKDIRARCRIYQSAGVIAGLVIVLILI